MRYICSDDLQPGMVFGKAVLDISGKELVQAGTVLSEDRLEKLQKTGYQGVFIEDDISEAVHIDFECSPFKYSLGDDCVKNGNIKELCKIAMNIVDDIVKRQVRKISIYKMQSYSDFLFCHSLNTAIYSTVIGLNLGLGREKLYKLATAAILHDVCLASIPSEIRNKEEKFTKTEIETINQHVLSAAAFLKEIGMDDEVVKAVLCHHENENGSGYPYGLTSDKICDYAKIIHVANTLDKMTTRRPNKKEYQVSDVFDYLINGTYVLFNKAVVNTAISCFDAYSIGSDIHLSNGDNGIIVDRTDNNLRPQLLILEKNETVDMSSDARYSFVTLKTNLFSEDVVGAQEPSESEEHKSAAHITGSVGGRKIVIVDDVFVFRRTAEIALSMDYKTVCFDNAYEAISYIETNEVALLVMDIEMPSMDGITAVKKLRTDGMSDLPVIYLTAVNDKNMVIECAKTGAVDYILKPIKPIYIYERVKEALKSI